MNPATTAALVVAANTPDSAGPAIFQAVGMLVAVIWGIWLMNRPTDAERDARMRQAALDEVALRERVRAHYQAEFEARTAPKPHGDRKPVDSDTVALVSIIGATLLGLVAATAWYVWGAA